jgi:hypothetical protein
LIVRNPSQHRMEDKKVSGIFLSYARADREHACRIVQGLSAVGVEVWWDEDMPGVDWQYELAQRITDMAAVLVLWSENSQNSKNVRDEARLADKKDKLINALIGLVEPPHPFDRNNGLPIDGWDGREPHRGWTRLVQTVENFIVKTGAASPGEIMAALTHLEQDWQGRMKALVRAREEFNKAQMAAEHAKAHAEEEAAALNNAQEQLAKIGELRFSREIIIAAQLLCDAKATNFAEADTAYQTARLRLSEALNALDSCAAALKAKSVELPETAPSKGPPSAGKAAGRRILGAERLEKKERVAEANAETETTSSECLVEPERRTVEIEQLVETAGKQPQQSAAPGQQRAMHEEGHGPTVEADVSRLQTLFRQSITLLKSLLISPAAAVIAIALLGWTGLYTSGKLTISREEMVDATSQSPVTGGSEVTSSWSTTPVEKSETADISPPSGEWLIGEWVINQADSGCKRQLHIARTEKTNELNFDFPNLPDLNGPDVFRMLGEEVVQTSGWRYVKLPTGNVRMQSISDVKLVQELSKCAAPS